MVGAKARRSHMLPDCLPACPLPAGSRLVFVTWTPFAAAR